MSTISEKLNPNRSPRESFGLKAESKLNRITLNPSSVNPGETYYLNIPTLSENKFFVPGSVYLRFDLNVQGHVNNTLVNNVARNLVSRLKVAFGDAILNDTVRYDLLKTYENLFIDREDKLSRGISSENMRRLRTNGGDKDTSNAKEVTLAAIHNTKYYIPIDHPILNGHGILYPRALFQPLRFEITFAPVVDVVVFSDEPKTANYKITNLELEY